MDEREFELINIIGAQIDSNQRDLSREMDLSLGMTNMLIRRVLAKGYIRISQLNKRKAQYILTPKGFAEKMRKSIKYTLKTINSIGLIKQRLQFVLKGLYDNGYRKFYVLGESDLSGLIDAVLNENFKKDFQVTHVAECPNKIDGGVVLICREKVSILDFGGMLTVNLIEELAKDEALVDHSVAFGLEVQGA